MLTIDPFLILAFLRVKEPILHCKNLRGTFQINFMIVRLTQHQIKEPSSVMQFQKLKDSKNRKIAKSDQAFIILKTEVRLQKMQSIN